MNAPTFTPDQRFSERHDDGFRPSWRANPDFLNREHREIFENTKDIPGWQMEGDTYKLYEMGYFAGDVILEIGVYGGRSAVVELKGALSSSARKSPPQFFGLDTERTAIERTHQTLLEHGLGSHSLLYLGNLGEFMDEFNIQPTMVFVDADHRYQGVKRDLDWLSDLLRPGVPVLCHDYMNKENDTGEYGVRTAANEWEEAGYGEFAGVFGCSALFVTTEKCRGGGLGLRPEAFARRRDALLRAYGLVPPGNDSVSSSSESARWRSEAQRLQGELYALSHSAAYRLGFSILHPWEAGKKLARKVQKWVR